MIRAYFMAVWNMGAFAPPKYELCYTDFKSMRDFKKNGNSCMCYFGLEKYDKKGKFVKKIKY